MARSLSHTPTPVADPFLLESPAALVFEVCMRTVPVKTYYLEMRLPPPRQALAQRPGLSFHRSHQPSLPAYRALYNDVGRDYRWVDRNLMPDAELLSILHDPRVEIYLLSVDGTVAGYAELDRRIDAEVEIAYLGLKPGFCGKGLGKYLLQFALARAWACQPARVWVHTCEWDHPAALPSYQKAGFVLYDEKIIQQTLP